MKIEIKNQTVKFEEVPIGSVFAYPAHSCSDRDIYIAIEEHLDRVDSDKINAVRLYDGSIHEFSEDCEVKLLNNAKLVIG